MFNHSCDHDQHHEDGLNIKNMSKKGKLLSEQRQSTRLDVEIQGKSKQEVNNRRTFHEACREGDHCTHHK